MSQSALKRVFSKIAGSGRKLISVPVSFVRPRTGRSPSFNSTVGIPFSYASKWIYPSLYTLMDSRSDSAFTTDEPTPWRPPLVL